LLVPLVERPARPAEARPPSAPGSMARYPSPSPPFHHPFHRQGLHPSPLFPEGRLRREQGVVDRLFGGLRDGLEAMGEQLPVLRQAAEGVKRRPIVPDIRYPVARGKGDHDIPAYVAGEGAGPGQSEHRPSGQTAKLLGIHRQVRRHDDDDGAVSFPFRRRPPELTSHRYAEQMKILPFSEVGKDQHADMIPITADRDAPGGGADSPFPAETDHARPGTDTPLLYRTGLGPPESLPGMFGADMEPTHIVQVAVVALRHHHIDRSRLFPDAAIPFHQI